MTVTGKVVARSPETVNRRFTGAIEVAVDTYLLESPPALPLQVNLDRETPEKRA